MPQKGEHANMDLANFTQVLEESEQVIRQCFEQYDLNQVFLSFNGGKDCTVLLDLTIKILKDIYKREDIGKDLKVMYIRTNSPFRELELFVKQVELHYGINLTVMEGDMKATLQNILDKDKRLKACLMGTRRTDPYSKELHFMELTDPKWPQLMRVSPLLNWSYHHIWHYIFQRPVPYCSLYDKGYTSIGSTLNTRPNPTLAYEDCSGRISYYPAWQLSDEALERAGRGNASHTTVNGHATCGIHNENNHL